MITEYLQACGLNQKEVQVYLHVFQHGPKTATQVSQRCGIERTNCYKIIQGLVEKGLAQSGEKNGVKQFWISKTNSIKQYLESKKEHFEKLEKQYETVEFELDKLRSHTSSVLPKIRLYEQLHGLKSLQETMCQSIKTQGCQTIQVYIKDTFEASGSCDPRVQELANEFIEFLHKNDINVQLRKGMGMELIEHIHYANSKSSLIDFSYGNGSAQLWIIGEDVFIIIYKEIPVGMKVQSKELAYMIYSLLEKGNF